MKKIVSVLLVLAMLTLVFAGCGSSGQAETPVPAPAASTEPASGEQPSAEVPAAAEEEYKQHKGGDLVIATANPFNNCFTPYEAGNTVVWGMACVEPFLTHSARSKFAFTILSPPTSNLSGYPDYTSGEVTCQDIFFSFLKKYLDKLLSNHYYILEVIHMTIGERIRSIRESRNITQTELAKASGVSKQNLYKYESNIITNIPSDKIEAIARYLDVSPALIMGWIDSPSQKLPDNILPMPPMKRWKVLGATACGDAIHIEFEDETVLAPADIDADYVFRCVGDSMVGAHIFDGDLVFIKHGEEVLDGQIGIVRVGDEYMLKRIYHGLDYLELRSENPAYRPKIIRGEQENAEIVGKAVKFLSSVI